VLPRPGELLHFSEDAPIRDERHGIDLRVLSELEPYFTRVRERGLEFSAIRMGNAGIGPAGPFATHR
jgi:hypothetical protein